MNIVPRLLASLLIDAALVSFAEGASQYILVNDIYRGQTELNFSKTNTPCLTAPLLQEWGIRQQEMQRLHFSSPAGCATARSLAGLKIRYYYDQQAQVFTLYIPPEITSPVTNGVATSRWDDGVNAAFLDYDLSYSHFTGGSYRRYPRQHSLDVTTTWGANLGPWRFRYQPVYSKDAYSDPVWHTENASAFRTIQPLRALLTLGDNSTTADMFDSVSYRGFSLATDDRMLPDEMRPLSPWIRGFAHSQAQVKIRQYGTVIYQTTVPAGAFILKDIYPADATADIEMTIKESDGTETVRTIPYSAMPNLVHDGQWKFALSAGKYRPYYTLDQQEPFFSQLSLSYGLPDNLSLFGSVMAADIWQAGLFGVGKRLDRWGALSLDVSYSHATDPRRTGSDHGTMTRLRYTKAFSEWESSFSLTAQYYPDQRYRTFSEAVAQQTKYWWDWEDGVFVGEFDAEKKNKIAVSYTQNLAEEDNLYLTLASEALRGRNRRETSVEVSYSASWHKIDYAIYLAYNRPDDEKEESKITFSFSIPFQLFSSPRIKLNMENTLAKNGDAERKVGISGTALEDYSLSYNLSTSQQEGKGSSKNLTLDYQYNAGELMAVYTRKKQTSTKYLGLTGSVMAHQGGVTFGQALGETPAIVEVEKTPGVGIINQYGTTTDSRGFAIISSLTPYRVNELSLDAFSLASGEELPDSEREVVPTAGAIMYSRFRAPTP
ncbi:fimbria/pilus outer membrane usher protein [Erwinia mallotivora]|nr:fimbria/pilus outer membrane usher protein [Erwinia mallotivora]